MEEEKEILRENYINSLNSIERIALKIAEENLESSFCLEKSIGFLNYLKKINERSD
jgi:hypothetical protein